MMIKQLLKQIWNERKSNSWLWAELLIVFIVLWFVIDMVYVTAVTYYEPLGFDIEDTYMVTLGNKTSKSASFIPAEQKTTTSGEDMLVVMERLRQLPEVEEVSLSSNARPYTGSNSGFRFTIDSITRGVLRRPVTPGFFRVFKYENVDGSGYEPLEKALQDGGVVISENLLPETYGRGRELIGKVLYDADDSTRTYRIAGVTHKVRYDDFWPNYDDMYVATLLKEQDIAKMNESITWYELCIRVKPGTGADFPEYLMGISDSQFNIGNFFILGVESFESLRDNFQLMSVNNVKTRFWMIAFLLINIFLGIIGTFWFRTQHRKSELGLRLAVGSTRKNLSAILIGEGLLILMFAVIPALIICYTLGNIEYFNEGNVKWKFTRFLIVSTVTLLLIGIMIILGILYPARQAMKVAPAEALRDE